MFKYLHIRYEKEDGGRHEGSEDDDVYKHKVKKACVGQQNEYRGDG